jgi:hypothetical protein
MDNLIKEMIRKHRDSRDEMVIRPLHVTEFKQKDNLREDVKKMLVFIKKKKDEGEVSEKDYSDMVKCIKKIHILKLSSIDGLKELNCNKLNLDDEEMYNEFEG